jgi:hypothetical protein
MLIVSFKVWPYHRFPVYCELGKHMHTLEEHGGCVVEAISAIGLMSSAVLKKTFP